MGETGISQRLAFKLFRFIPLYKTSQAYQQYKLIKKLKLEANFLLISTIIEEYKNLNILDYLSIFITNVFSKRKIKVLKKDGATIIQYSSFKISLRRSLVLLPNYFNKKGFVDNIRKTKFCGENLYFTYPKNLLEIDKTIVFYKNKQRINIIPWLDCIYFEISIKEDAKLNDGLDILNSYFPDYNIDIENVLSYGVLTFNSNKISYDKQIALSKKYEKDLNLKGNLPIKHQPLKIMEYCDERYDEAKHILHDPLYFKQLFYNYGIEVEKITNQAYEYWNKIKDVSKTWLFAEIWYVKKYENCQSFDEFIYNHTNLWMKNNEIEIDFVKRMFEQI